VTAHRDQSYAGPTGGDSLDLRQLDTELRHVGLQTNRLELSSLSSELQRVAVQSSCAKLNCREFSAELDHIAAEMRSSLNLCHLHYELERCGEQTQRFSFNRIKSELNRINDVPR
jgi:hypothetical protein